MKSTDNRKNIHILNRVLIGTVICIVVLFAIFVILLIKQDREMDLSQSYSPQAAENSGKGSEFSLQKAPAFASGLCVSEGAVVLPDVMLQGNTEKGLLFNLDTGEALFAQGIYDQAYPASITKIMTAILAVKYGTMEDQVVMAEGDFALEEGSQVSGMAAGDIVTMDQLFHALVVYSANDAAMAIARQIGGTVDHFVEMMNEEALALGMTGTHFINPHGLHDGSHYTTAYDVYLMLNEAFRYSAFTDAIQMNMYHLKVTRGDGSQVSFRLDSTAKYLTGEKTAPKNVNLLGGKTGTTSEAGACLAIIAQNAYGVPYMAVILNADNRSILYEDMNKLLMQINS